MTQEQKQLLLQDLSARLPYGVKLLYNSNSIAKIKDRIEILRGITIGYTIWFETNYNHSEYDSTSGSYEHFEPYLRPMSSMTEEERMEFTKLFDKWHDDELFDYIEEGVEFSIWKHKGISASIFDWLNAHHFDYRGLIPMGLALKAPEGMYVIK